MEQLSYKVLKEQGYDGYLLQNAPERILQYGEGNFLRAFADYFIDCCNEKVGFNSKVVLVQPIPGGEFLRDKLNTQEGLFTLYLRGQKDGNAVNRKRVISSISRCLNSTDDNAEVLKCAENPEIRYIISNTTEAGIAYDPACQFEDEPASSFPAKLTKWLFTRYNYFKGDSSKGVIILSCELIDDNGKELKRCVDKYVEQWGLDAAFEKWLNDNCLFCSTLVDRIVTGYPRADAEKLNNENGYIDDVMDTAELFGLWVIEGPKYLEEELPFIKAGLPVLVTQDIKPYKMQKVRVLNGTHTTMVSGAFLSGINIVRDAMKDEVIRPFVEKVIDGEILPTLQLDHIDCNRFAVAVRDRFLNPFIDHALLSITLNDTSKYHARVLPTVKEYIGYNGSVPKCLTMGLACMMEFYRRGRFDENGEMFGMRDGVAYPIKDDKPILDFYASLADASTKDFIQAVLSNEHMWGEDLTKLPGFAKEIEEDFALIESVGVREAIKTVTNK